MNAPTTYSPLIKDKAVCFHCGDVCADETVYADDKNFCCQGCRWVYQLLSDHDMKRYYDFTEGKGLKGKKAATGFEYLDLPEIRERFVRFSHEGVARATLFLPQIHCSACIWLLENLSRLDSGVRHVQVDFLRKEAAIQFTESSLSLRGLAELVTSIGYEPDFSRASGDQSPVNAVDRSVYVKLGIAGFCFGNMMLLALPDYLSGGGLEPGLSQFFRQVSIILGLPLIYSLSGFFKGAWISLREKTLTMDVPISMGAMTLTGRSLYEIISGTGPGYLDTLAGLSFFLLIGKIFQMRTFHTLSFDRNYRAYFPLAVRKKTAAGEISVSLDRVAIHDHLILRHQELIPADSSLDSEQAMIDYSFVTGESLPVEAFRGDRLYAGGRLTSASAEITVVHEVSQSYLTQLWNQPAFTDGRKSSMTGLSEAAAKYFTILVLGVATATAVYWMVNDPSCAVDAVTSVLIVACGCGLPLSIPFTFGTALRLMADHKFYVKNYTAVERMAAIDMIVLDKTGTLTRPQSGVVQFEGAALSEKEKILIYSLVRQSAHPLSDAIGRSLGIFEPLPFKEFTEMMGCGLKANIGGYSIKIGSALWVGSTPAQGLPADLPESGFQEVFVAIDNRPRGRFRIESEWRSGADELRKLTAADYEVAVLSGDSDREKQHLEKIFHGDVSLHFRQSPMDKLQFINRQQRMKRRVMMVGDGLNDAGALRQSDVGVAVAEDTATFTPGSDAIIEAESLGKIPVFLELAKKSKKVVAGAFTLTILYNLFALSLAIHGDLSPVIAAILMPVSSVSVVAFTVAAVRLYGHRLGLHKENVL